MVDTLESLNQVAKAIDRELSLPAAEALLPLNPHRYPAYLAGSAIAREGNLIENYFISPAEVVEDMGQYLATSTSETMYNDRMASLITDTVTVNAMCELGGNIGAVFAGKYAADCHENILKAAAEGINSRDTQEHINVLNYKKNAEIMGADPSKVNGIGEFRQNAHKVRGNYSKPIAPLPGNISRSGNWFSFLDIFFPKSGGDLGAPGRNLYQKKFYQGNFTSNSTNIGNGSSPIGFIPPLEMRGGGIEFTDLISLTVMFPQGKTLLIRIFGKECVALGISIWSFFLLARYSKYIFRKIKISFGNLRILCSRRNKFRLKNSENSVKYFKILIIALSAETKILYTKGVK